jgi:hypothetical protein
MSTQPVDDLQHRAEEQRRQIHATAEELKGKISEAKDKLDLRKNLREHLFAVAMAVGVMSLLVGTLIVRKFRR